MELISYLLGKKSSGGGSTGLEYEEGTFKPTQNVTYPIIPFSNAHTKSPDIICIRDEIETTKFDFEGTLNWYYIDIERLLGHGFAYPGNGNPTRKGYVCAFVTSTNSNHLAQNTGTVFSYSSSETGNTGSYPCFYVTNEQFKPGYQAYIANHTYKWKAYWISK